MSEIISYVILIAISLGMATGVYFWISFYVPGLDKEACPEEITLGINNYYCDEDNSIISLEIKNNGNFNVSGFYLRVSGDEEKIPTLGLNSTNNPNINFGGRYFFLRELKPGAKENCSFSYDIEEIDSVKKIQIEPFILTEDRRDTLACKNSIITQRVDECG